MRRLRAKKNVQGEDQLDQDEAKVGPSESIEVEEEKEDKQEKEEIDENDEYENKQEEEEKEDEHEEEEIEDEHEAEESKGEDDDLCNAIAESFNEEELVDQVKEVEENVQMEEEEIPETVQSEITTSVEDMQVSDDDTASMEKNLADIFSVPEEVDGEDEEDDDDVLVCHTEDETLEELNKEETDNKVSETVKEEVLLDPEDVKDLLKCQVKSISSNAIQLNSVF